jgi:hypothetical protein
MVHGHDCFYKTKTDALVKASVYNLLERNKCVYFLLKSQ